MQPGQLQREVIKLLIQVAWVNQEIAEEERTHILGVASGAGLTEDELDEIRRALERTSPLTAPDFNLLKQYRQEVKRAVTVLIRRDGRVSADEAALLANIDELLAD